LRQAAVAVTGKPVRYVVDSHFHNDHIRGNQEFSGARIVSTVGTRKAIAENEPEEIAWEKTNAPARLSAEQKALAAERDNDRRAEDRFWVKYYEAIIDSHGSLRTVLPDVTFEGKLVLHGPKRSVELLETGRGHTESDLILFLPAERIVFTGDLLFINRHPYLPDGFPADWLRSLERVKALDVHTIVPGHGPVGDTSHLATMIGYIKAVEAMGAGLAKRGATEHEFASQTVPPAFQRWWYSRFFQPNLKYMINLAKEKASGK
jgi:glyoxylase-like metal-dependent hydrolase (beta-lactamase superfamily II)